MTVGGKGASHHERLSASWSLHCQSLSIMMLSIWGTMHCQDACFHPLSSSRCHHCSISALSSSFNTPLSLHAFSCCLHCVAMKTDRSRSTSSTSSSTVSLLLLPLSHPSPHILSCRSSEKSYLLTGQAALSILTKDMTPGGHSTMLRELQAGGTISSSSSAVR